LSYTTITQATRDTALGDRVESAAQKEARNNPTFADTDVGRQVRQAPSVGIQLFFWPVSIDYEAAYEAAILNEVPNPGGDPSVITDANIQAAIQNAWPPDPT
jgi:hypothetical protein